MLSRTNKENIPLIILILGFLIFSFHFSNPIIATFLGGQSTGFSLELFSTFFFIFFCYQRFISNVLLQVLVPYLLFVLLMIIGSRFASPISYREFTTPISHLIIMSGSFYLFSKYPKIIFKYIDIILLFSVFLFVIWILVAYLSGNVLEENSREGLRFQIFGMRSTEFPIIMGSQFCYLMYLYDVHSTNKNLTIKSIYFTIIVFYVIILTYLSGARSVLLGVLLIVFLFNVLKKGISFKLLLFVIILMMVALFFGFEKIFFLVDRLNQTLQGNAESDIRVLIYSDLIDKASTHPYWGIGHGNFKENNSILAPWHQEGGVVPHQNFLGRAAENGIPAAICYLAFVIIYFYVIRKKLSFKQDDIKYKSFIIACISLFAYHQFRGLIQDTWSIKELSFAVGASLGLKAYIINKNEFKEYL